MTRLAHRLMFAQAIDVATFCAFFLLVHTSVHVERNPLIAVPMAFGGFAFAGFLKMAYVTVVAHRATRFPESRKLVVAISVATASGIVGAGFNLASLWDSLT